MEYDDIYSHTTTLLPECNNNDLTFSVKDSSHNKKTESKSHSKVKFFFFECK